ncbi:hypothetical protein AVEN_62694-1 [Araneus ventricosus]|uniref:Uncharacterized protein n=1 Tax=Araneus ventricosus TaxID=182803 RepID=A0A4Y2FIS8_ARAVE|nr:hypothetical protein AVEN_62694-1 [Araneus ventricosus]
MQKFPEKRGTYELQGDWRNHSSSEGHTGSLRNTRRHGQRNTRAGSYLTFEVYDFPTCGGETSFDVTMLSEWGPRASTRDSFILLFVPVLSSVTCYFVEIL